MKLSDFFQSSETITSTHSWLLSSHDPLSIPDRDTLARIVADRIIEHQCRGAKHHYLAWKQRFDGGELLSTSSQDALRRAFIGPVFGLPEEPDTVPLDHLEGYVSQMLWYFFYLDSPPEEIIRVEPPGFRSTDPGGDALAVHRIGGSYLMFRLWEIKKYTGTQGVSGGVSSTVNDAYNQLNAKALEYLARYTAIGQEISDNPELTAFYGQLVDLWLEAQQEATVGISVATSLCHVPEQCFTTFGAQFPRFTNPIRLRGMLTAVGDFTIFALLVRDYIWRGL